jgi:hypothetical protein
VQAVGAVFEVVFGDGDAFGSHGGHATRFL